MRDRIVAGSTSCCFFVVVFVVFPILLWIPTIVVHFLPRGQHGQDCRKRRRTNPFGHISIGMLVLCGFDIFLGRMQMLKTRPRGILSNKKGLSLLLNKIMDQSISRQTKQASEQIGQYKGIRIQPQCRIQQLARNGGIQQKAVTPHPHD